MNDQQPRPSFIERFIQGMEGRVKTPFLTDPALQRKAAIIQTLSSLGLVTGFAALAITPFIFQDSLRGVSITIGMMLILFLIRVLNRRGRTRLAAQLFLGSIWLFDFALVLFSGGFNSQFLSILIPITIIGGLILGEMYAFHVAGISIAAFLLLALLDNRGLTPEVIFVFSPSAIILINVVNLLLAASVLIMVIQRYEQNLRELTGKEKDLERANLDMEREIQARERAQTRLRLSENQLKSALKASPYPAMLLAEDGEVLLVNPTWTQNSGYPEEKMTDLEDWLDQMFRESSPRVVEILDQLAADDTGVEEGFFEIYKADGETLKWHLHWTKLPEQADGRNLFLAMATDLTDLVNIESTLREREETLSKFSLVTNDGLWDWDLRTDQVIFDPLYYTMAGYEVNEFPYHLNEFKQRVHPDDVEVVFNQAEKHLKGETDRFNVEFRFLHKDGSWLWIMGRGKITEQDENGNPIRFAGTHTDISAQKLVEEKLSNYQLQLEDIVEYRTQELNDRITEVERLNAALTNILDDYQAANERLSELGDNLSAANQELESLTYSLSTDLLFPIQAIQEKTSGLIKKSAKSLSERELSTVYEIQSCAELVTRQINDLLLISQLSQQKLDLAEIEPVKLVKRVFKSFSKQIKNNNIKTTIKDLPGCVADRDLLEVVFTNLVSNAIKYSSGQESPEILVGYQPDQEADRVIYYVQDNGIGFNPEDSDLVFGAFQQLDNQANRQGSGIGLTLAKLIINKHNGKIWAESEESKGATFYFDLAIPSGDEG